LFAHRLADLVRRQLADHVRPEDQRDRERRKAGEHGAQRDVVEDVEYPYVFRQPLRDLEKHSVTPLVAAAGQHSHHPLHLHEARTLDKNRPATDVAGELVDIGEMPRSRAESLHCMAHCVAERKEIGDPLAARVEPYSPVEIGPVCPPLAHYDETLRSMPRARGDDVDLSVYRGAAR